MFRYKIVLGDYSCDGHGRYEIYWVNSTFSKKEIKKIYKNVTKKIGFSFVDEFEDYEKTEISNSKAEALSQYLECEPSDIFEEYKGEYSIDDQSFLTTLVLLLNKSKDQLNMIGEIVEEVEVCDGSFNNILTDNYNIGYGFYS